MKFSEIVQSIQKKNLQIGDIREWIYKFSDSTKYLYKIIGFNEAMDKVDVEQCGNKDNMWSEWIGNTFKVSEVGIDRLIENENIKD